MLKRLLIVLAVVGLVVAPVAGRWLYYYKGWPHTRQIDRPNLASVAARAPEMPAFVDAPTPAPVAGTVLIDRAHDNRFQMSELNVLQARLSARGQRLEPVEASDSLAGQLRYARALAIIAPGTSLTAAEIETVKEFVDKGGRLLLVGDPTRYGVLLDDFGDVTGLDSDSTHLNDLAAQFGLVFQPDYLYNTADNEGNFRNIRLTDIGSDALTGGLKQVVFYAAHSIITQDEVLISAGGETRSSSSERGGALPVAALAADGAVLALGDLTFMTEPYNATDDNDRLVANVADFLSGAQRRYELADFPYFFGDRVDLVYTGDPLLDSDLLKGGSALQDLFEGKDKVLAVRQEADDGADTLYFGLYREAEDVQPYLASAGVTLVISETETTAAKAEPAGGPAPAITRTAGVTATPPVTLTPSIASEAEVTATAEISPTAGGRADVEALGRVVLSGTAMLLLQSAGERDVLVVLASTEAGLENAVKRLGDGDLADCILQETGVATTTILALCPSGEVAEGRAPGGWDVKPAPAGPTPPAPAATSTLTTTVTPTQPVTAPKGKIVVVGLDKGQGAYDSLSDAADWAEALAGYDVTVWSESKDGVPALDDVIKYDLVIWATGDFKDPFGEDESQVLVGLMMAETPMVVSGAYFNKDSPNAVQRDIQVASIDHAILKGFTQGETIEFVAPPSGKEYSVNLLTSADGKGSTTLFNRGPKSESAGAPSVVLLEDSGTALKFLYIGFPLYLLPSDARAKLALNVVGWMVGQ